MKSLDGWSASEAYKRVEQRYANVNEVTVDIRIPDKANAMMEARLNVRMRDDHADYPALLLVSHIFDNRFRCRLRGEVVLSYDAGSRFNAHPHRENAGFLAPAIFAPGNPSRVVSAFREKIDRMLTWSFPAEILEEAKHSHGVAARMVVPCVAHVGHLNEQKMGHLSALLTGCRRGVAR